VDTRKVTEVGCRPMQRSDSQNPCHFLLWAQCTIHAKILSPETIENDKYLHTGYISRPFLLFYWSCGFHLSIKSGRLTSHSFKWWNQKKKRSGWSLLQTVERAFDHNKNTRIAYSFAPLSYCTNFLKFPKQSLPNLVSVIVFFFCIVLQ